MHTTALWKSETENDPSWILWVKAQRTQLLPFAQILTIIIRGGKNCYPVQAKKQLSVEIISVLVIYHMLQPPFRTSTVLTGKEATKEEIKVCN